MEVIVSKRVETVVAKLKSRWVHPGAWFTVVIHRFQFNLTETSTGTILSPCCIAKGHVEDHVGEPHDVKCLHVRRVPSQEVLALHYLLQAPQNHPNPYSTASIIIRLLKYDHPYTVSHRAFPNSYILENLQAY
jgi:hypothetical protein